MALKLAQSEKETHFNLVADNRGTWEVYSDDEVMQARLEKAGAQLVRESGPGKHYTLEASQVSIRKPTTDERREKNRESLAKAREAKRQGG